jgi:nucleoside-diphosphate-sugar epimerase
MILVTGGTGLLGSHLLFQLSEKNASIKAIYRDKKKCEIVNKLFRYYDPINGQEKFNLIEWVECDVLDITTLFEVMTNCDYVYHCAAIVSFHKRDFFNMMKLNRQGTSNIVNCCLELNIKKLCYVSSTAAIGGNEEDAIISEKTKWKQSPTTSGYSISKYSAEKEVWRGVEEGLDVIIINPCVIIGAGNWEESSLTMFKTIENGMKFYTEGENAFVDARDVCKSMLFLMESEIKNERFLCIGENASFKLLFDTISKKLNKKAATILVKPWLMGLTWRFIWLFCKLTGKKSAITRETARSAFGKTIYDDSKLKNEIDFSFYLLEEMVENAVNGRIMC